MIQTFNMFEEFLDEVALLGNKTIYDSFLKTYPKLESKNKIVIAISGGSDSDVMFDLVIRTAIMRRIPLSKFHFIFFDTGIEYEATKKHLEKLEQLWRIKIERIKAIKPVPLGCKQFGVPFWSKRVSDMIERLQKHNFKWEDKPFEELIKEYPKCRSSLRWWCNQWGEGSQFNIEYVKCLKEFIIANPPQFKISGKCCAGAKKNNAKKYLQDIDADLNMYGVRKAEGGARATAYKSCFDEAKDGQTWDVYRPIFWFTNKDKEQYEKKFNIKHSDCYTKYGLKRTGCAGCPFGKDFEKELDIIQQYEPKLHKAVNNIFGDSYEYTRKFIKFREKDNKRIQTLFDLMGE